MGEAKEEVPREAQLLHLAVLAGIMGSQTTPRTIVGGRKENVCAVGVQTTNLPTARSCHETEVGASNRRGPILDQLRWKGLNLKYRLECTR